MSKKKSYNPLKMFGSWIGAGIGFLISLQISFGLIKSYGVVDYTNSWFYLGLLWQISLGFLIGWGIHSLIRKLRRK